MSDIYIRDLENDLTYVESTGDYVLTSSLFDNIDDTTNYRIIFV